MFVGVITVPLLVAQSLKLPPNETGYLVSMGLIASGLGTLVQVRGFGAFGSRLLSVQGTSFAFLVPLIQAGQAGGLPLMLGMSLLCAPVELVLAQFLVRLQRLFTPLVSGTVVLLIGLSLIPVGFKTMAAGLGGNSPAWAGLAVAALVVIVVFGLNAIRSPWARIGAIPIALGIGYLLCCGLGFLPADTGGLRVGYFATTWLDSSGILGYFRAPQAAHSPMRWATPQPATPNLVDLCLTAGRP